MIQRQKGDDVEQKAGFGNRQQNGKNIKPGADRKGGQLVPAYRREQQGESRRRKNPGKAQKHLIAEHLPHGEVKGDEPFGGVYAGKDAAIQALLPIVQESGQQAGPGN